MLDQKKISYNPAVELSYLKPEEQKNVIEAMDFTQAAPSLSQAQRLKKLSQESGCTLEDMFRLAWGICEGGGEAPFTLYPCKIRKHFLILLLKLSTLCRQLEAHGSLRAVGLAVHNFIFSACL